MAEFEFSIVLFEVLSKGIDDGFATSLGNMRTVRPETVLNHSNGGGCRHLMETDAGSEIDEGIEKINEWVGKSLPHPSFTV